MRYAHILLFVPVITLFLQCATRQKITYNIPANYSKEQKEKLMAELDKGQELYKMYCTQCHGIFTKGDNKIPNFTNQQIDNYAARFMRHDPKNHAAAIKMSSVQLIEILEFLKYKKIVQ